MFGIGGFELFLILLFGFLIFGPDKLPGIAKTIGNAISRFRNAQKDINKTLNNEFFDKNSDQPFKNPLDAIESIANTSQNNTAITAGKTASTGEAAAETVSANDSPTASLTEKSAATGSDHTETFAERKARYDRERAQRKAAETEGV